MTMIRRVLTLPLLALLIVSLLGVVSATPTRAYGAENWQVGFSGTGTAPGTGFGFGFWGWCAFGGGVTSGNTADCQFAQYVHAPAGGGFTCHESIDATSWDASGGTFVIESGTVTVTPASLTGPCLSIFPGPGGLPVDTGFPAAAGHYNFGSLGPGLVGKFVVQVAQIG
jgi:hypothetical protein